MLALLLLALAQTPQHRLFQQPNLPSGSLYATFEAFPSSGAGTTGVCSTTAPTSARGSALTFTRASTATCTKTASGGLATTGIANGDLVSLSSNVARVEYDSAGTLGLLVESAGASICLRSAEICNAVYADVGTPGCLSDQAAGPFGTTTMDSVTDNDAAAFEGRSQSIADTSQTAHTASAYVKSSTATSASITMVGAGNSAGDCTGTVTGLSSTTSKIVTCTGAAYGVGLTAVVVTIRVGTVVADTGVLLVEGMDVKASAPYLTSHIPTGAAGATRAADDGKFILSPVLGNFSIAANFQTPSTTPVMRLHGSLVRSPDDGANFIGSYRDSPSFRGQFVSTAGTALVLDGTTSTTGRAASYFDGTLIGACINSSCTTAAKGAFSLSNFTNPLAIQVGTYSATNGNIDGIQTRICFEPNDPARCR